MFFLHPKQEKEQESQVLFNKFVKYLCISAAVITAMRIVPYTIKR